MKKCLTTEENINNRVLNKILSFLFSFFRENKN